MSVKATFSEGPIGVISGRAFIVVDGNEDKRLSVKLFPSPVFPDNLPNAFNFMISRGKPTRGQPRRGDSFVF